MEFKLNFNDFSFKEILSYIPNGNWMELKWGLEHECVSSEDVIRYAKIVLEDGMDNFDTILELAISNSNEDIYSLLSSLSRSEDECMNSIMNKWRFAILLWLYFHREEYENVYEIIAILGADFHHPADMNGFIYYMPISGYASGSGLLSEWKQYLKEEIVNNNLKITL